jgi:hypothetical protein
MPKLIPTVLALLAVGLFGVALLAMSAERFAVAGLSFLGVSLLVYFRENRLKQG